MKKLQFLLMSVVALLLVASKAKAECPDGMRWVQDNNIVCDYDHNGQYVCSNDYHCEEILPEDDDWTPIISGGTVPMVLDPRFGKHGAESPVADRKRKPVV